MNIIFYLAGWCGIMEAKSLFLQPSRTRATEPGVRGSSGSGDTVTSINFTYFHAESGLIRARS